MPLELWNTIATCATFVVIAATAVAAAIQLRHARGGNQIAALAELRTSFQALEFSEALNFVVRNLPELMKDPEFRYQLLHRAERTPEHLSAIQRVNFLGNYFEDMGALLIAGLLDKTATNTIYSSDIVIVWEALLPVLALMRREYGTATWENFEYAAMLAKDWLAAHPNGNYPHGARRLDVPDAYSEADAAYAATRKIRVANGLPVAEHDGGTLVGTSDPSQKH